MNNKREQPKACNGKTNGIRKWQIFFFFFLKGECQVSIMGYSIDLQLLQMRQDQLVLLDPCGNSYQNIGMLHRTT